MCVCVHDYCAYVYRCLRIIVVCLACFIGCRHSIVGLEWDHTGMLSFLVETCVIWLSVDIKKKLTIVYWCTMFGIFDHFRLSLTMDSNEWRNISYMYI